MRSLHVQSLTSAALLALAGCVAPSEPPPRAASPVPVPVPTRAPPPPPAPRPTPTADWRDWPLSPGTWTYRRESGGSVAAFGPMGAAPVLSLQCDSAGGRITLSRWGAAAGAASATVRTSSTVRALTLTRGAGAELSATLGARDALIDAMGFSRGRFVVEMAGQPPLVVPAWAEILRVAEDCRR